MNINLLKSFLALVRNDFNFTLSAEQLGVWGHHILQFCSLLKYIPRALLVRAPYEAFCCYTAPDIPPASG